MHSVKDKLDALGALDLTGKVLDDNESHVSLHSADSVIDVPKNAILSRQDNADGSHTLKVARHAQIIQSFVRTPHQIAGMTSARGPRMGMPDDCQGDCDCRCECRCDCGGGGGDVGGDSPPRAFRRRRS